MFRQFQMVRRQTYLTVSRVVVIAVSGIGNNYSLRLTLW